MGSFEHSVSGVGNLPSHVKPISYCLTENKAMSTSTYWPVIDLTLIHKKLQLQTNYSTPARKPLHTQVHVYQGKQTTK